ncbi:hypothetical protein Sgly_0780 [Syntrophobotulus glycolicus DSM 8271]|uniref:Uncharacterized protein n=1 Tax=Syntrophobotulus glycolicus (strain DSM 8271 / FlGlyR) TaxID=645991 RepID=F0T173_SYNGF|nr:hypothetical protein [Syntrophobotulus glycolicus]ADY55137.1 hypothetical protein Sgly_0780 [Syntrophobotulus glycolicus DSM 8271]
MFDSIFDILFHKIPNLVFGLIIMGLVFIVLAPLFQAFFGGPLWLWFIILFILFYFEMRHTWAKIKAKQIAAKEEI